MTTRPGFSFCICPDGKLLRQQVEELLGAHPDAGRERHVFWGDDELPPKFWEILTLQGLFSTSRVLVMRNAHALTVDVWKRLSAALSRPNPQTWPLFCLEVAWEKGQPKIPAHIAKLPCFTFADAKGWIWRSPGLEPRSLRRHIQIRSKALGLDLEPGCVDILAETLLPDAAAVDAELSKLQLLAGGKPLTQEQARSVSPTTEFNVFAFLRQLQAGQTASVWKSILEEQAKGEEPLFYLLAMLQREARQLWQILAGEQVRMGPSDQQAKQQTASRLGAAGLAKLWDAMHTAELSVKSGRRSPSQALDALMGDLTFHARATPFPPLTFFFISHGSSGLFPLLTPQDCLLCQLIHPTTPDIVPGCASVFSKTAPRLPIMKYWNSCWAMRFCGGIPNRSPKNCSPGSGVSAACWTHCPPRCSKWTAWVKVSRPFGSCFGK